ncbi:uncharacterized protein TNCV_2960391 [Trichonephila clavipes]|nr:uncharacterized protein TNCV_2960391 [Trichonephila clavipes]
MQKVHRKDRTSERRIYTFGAINALAERDIYIGQWHLRDRSRIVALASKVIRPGKQFNLVIDEEPLDNECHVWSCIIVLKYGCGHALKVRTDNWPQQLGDVAQAVSESSLHGVSRLESDHRGVADRCVTRQKRQLHSILPPTSFFHRIIGGGDVCGSASRVEQAMDFLRTDHSAVTGVEWYAQTLNDVLQTQFAVLWFVICMSDPSLKCAQFACPHVKWCTEMDVIDHVGPSYTTASKVTYPHYSCLVSSNTTTDFSER